MTSEESFQAALDAHPDDWQTRLVFADWLEDGDDPRAEGYRALARHRFSPCHLRPTSDPRHDHWMFQLLPTKNHPSSKPYTFDDAVPALVEWFRAFEPSVFGSHHPSRREAEDAAARAFAELPEARRAELLAREVTT